MEQKWQKDIADFLKGKTIAEVRYMSPDECAGMMWHHRPIVIIFTDGRHIYPSMDDEGNDGGALFTSSDELPVIPVMR